MTNRSKKYFAIKWAERELKKFRSILEGNRGMWDFLNRKTVSYKYDEKTDTYVWK